MSSKPSFLLVSSPPCQATTLRTLETLIVVILVAALMTVTASLAFSGALSLHVHHGGRSFSVIPGSSKPHGHGNHLRFNPYTSYIPKKAATVALAADHRQVVIASRQNQLAKRVRALHDAKGRKEAGLLLLEGTHMLDECLKRGLDMDTVVITTEWESAHTTMLQNLPEDVELYLVSRDVMSSIATTVSPDGVLTLIPPPYKGRPMAKNFVLALDFMQDPGNLGTLLRTAAAVNIEQVWMGGGADPYQPKVLRAAAGAALLLPIERTDDLGLRLEDAREAGMRVIAAVVDGGTPYWDVDWMGPTVLLVGSEGQGVNPDLLQHADIKVNIPHSHNVESLNVAVAAGVLLFERRRQLATSQIQ